MGKVDEYINSLDGVENIDPAVIAQTLLQLHNEEISTANAHIAELTTQNQDKESAIAARDAEIQKQMAANWRLANQVPADNRANQGNNNPPVNEEGNPPSFDDFFVKDEA